MLLQLSIHHLALINDMIIDFEPGMNVMTGETGAGKSIVVDAVNLVLGERADRDLITNGEMKARVEAVFDIADNEKVKAETASYVPIPEISSFVGEDGKDHMEEIVRENYYRVKADVAELVLREIARIEADPKLSQLLPKKKQG